MLLCLRLGICDDVVNHIVRGHACPHIHMYTSRIFIILFNIQHCSTMYVGCRGPRVPVEHTRHPKPVSCRGHGNESVSRVEEHRRPTKQCPNVDALYSWMGKHRMESQRVVDIRYQDDVQGWGLVAKEDISEGCLLVDVPMEYTIHSSERMENHVPWNVQMVSTLLENATSDGWKDWVAAMPAHVDIPWIYWEEEEIAELQDGDVIREVHELCGFLKSLQEYLGMYTWDDVLWAFSIVHSRSFLCGNQHIFVPVIDMANHSHDNNASVRTNFSPSNCQGREAQEEIAPVNEEEDSSTFQLIASRDIPSSEQITISYGSLPNDVLLLYFGFALPDNEHDQVVVFQNLNDAISAISTILGVPGIVAEDTPHKNEKRFFVMNHGADPRLLEIIASTIHIAGMENTHTVAGILKKVCQHHLAEYSTSLEDDSLSMSTPSNDTNARYLTALSFRYNKKAILHNVIASL